MQETLEEYILRHTTAESPHLEALNRRAHLELIRPRMLSGHLQGQLLKMLTSLTGARHILEVGTYTAYAALAMAEALPPEGWVDTIEIDDEIEPFVRERLAEHPRGEQVRLHMGSALELIPQLMAEQTYQLVYIDANKREYPEYYRLVMAGLPVGGLILADNTLWDGKVVGPLKESDIQTKKILEFNQRVAEDPRVEQLILPIRDGLSMIRKIAE